MVVLADYSLFLRIHRAGHPVSNNNKSTGSGPRGGGYILSPLVQGSRLPLSPTMRVS
jgi:hypothetical protein